MMAVMKNEVVEPAFPLGPAAASPAEHHRARDLNERELDEVAGGVANLVSGGIGAGIGGLIGGARYAVNSMGTGSFAWGSFTAVTLRTAVTGFLIGSGSSLIAAAATGAIRGGAVLGTSMVGAGGALEVASGAPGQGGGSERE
jgi:lactobin A/cerein 7B family class IIb bacteriocin